MRRFLSIYLVLSFILLIAILGVGVFFSVRLYREGQASAHQSFLSLRDTVKTYFESSGTTYDIGLALKGLFKRLVDSKQFSAIMLSNKEGAVLAEASTGKYIQSIVSQNSNRSSYDIKGVSPLEVVMEQRIDGTDFVIKAVSPFLSQEKAVDYLIRALFVIGSYFLLNLLAAIGFALSGMRSETAKKDKSENKEKQQNPEEEKDGLSVKNKTKTDRELSFLMDRIESDIRASEYEAEDLCLVLARLNPKIDGFISDSRMETLFGPEYRGYLFRNRTFVWIIRNRKIQEALALIKEVYPGLKKDSGINTPAFFGISSRNSRLISAEELFKEAKRALAKALRSQSNPVFAFYADPDKYRDYLAKSASSNSV
ncbi:hypothetical protein WKV44_05975 [Spirochaetia bacterium 38H-sp]|uniref:GGDEF domain-containing protein n=1 Tax=Rarispira pelagica TaxID=3141764 RepID=A0ABU9UBN9_9SPIR